MWNSIKPSRMLLVEDQIRYIRLTQLCQEEFVECSDITIPNGTFVFHT